MSNHLYGYSLSNAYGGRPPTSPPNLALSSLYSSTRALSDSYRSDPALRYLTTSELDPLFHDLPTKYSSSFYRHLTRPAPYLPPSHTTWPPGVDVPPISRVEHLLPTGIKRSSEALYNQTVLGAQNTVGQSEAWYTPYSLGKRTRLESGSVLPVYPQRPGQKDCAHYMQTRACKFGDSCKFDHPIWVPEGGIPDWKEVPVTAKDESLPERIGEPDCPYFLKTQRCKFGSQCRFNHPKDNLSKENDLEKSSVLPERPSESPCAFYMKTGKCKFGTTCKFHHPKEIQNSSGVQDNDNCEQSGSVLQSEGATTAACTPTKPDVITDPALYHNSKGLPVRLGKEDCPFYLKTGSCKYGANCRYSHPGRNVVLPASVLGHSLIASPSTSSHIGVTNPAASVYRTVNPGVAQQIQLGIGSTIYPQRLGQLACDYYMKTGECKFGDECRFNHPINRTVGTQSVAAKLSLAGLPRREGAAHCPFYMKTGTCKYGAQCRFDHPPPGEAMAMAMGASQKASDTEATNDEIKGIVKGEAEAEAEDVADQ